MLMLVCVHAAFTFYARAVVPNTTVPTFSPSRPPTGNPTAVPTTAKPTASPTAAPKAERRIVQIVLAAAIADITPQRLAALLRAIASSVPHRLDFPPGSLAHTGTGTGPAHSMVARAWERGGRK
jgi:hypothetical protein